MINKNILIHFSFLVLSIIYVVFLFSRIPHDNFFYIGDQFFRFNKEETFANAFFIRKMLNFGVFNAWQLTVQTPDILYYAFIYSLGFNLIWAEKILFTLQLFITLSCSYLGFKKLSKLYFDQTNTLVLLAITFWYSMNPYLMVLWHGGVYNLGSSLTYSLAPLIIYYFHLSLTKNKPFRERIICALLFFAASFTFWMTAALCILLLGYAIALLYIYRQTIGSVILNALKFLAIYIPMASMIIFTIYHEFSNNKGDLNGTFFATFGSIAGGLLYQLMMWFSWGIYNKWTPRSIYPGNVTDFYYSAIYLAATACIYLLLFFLLYRRLELIKWNRKEFVKTNYIFIIFITIFFVSIFLAKGSQPPFGGIFLFLYEHVPFFTVFRSSDHRFGFPAVLSLSLAILALTKDLPKSKAFIAVLVVITFIQNFIFFSGDLIIGQNLQDKYVDRVVHISKPYQDLADYLNKQKDTYYILPNPSLEYGTFNFDKDETHMGQDILPKIINKPFADVPVTSAMNIDTGIILTAIVQRDIPNGLILLPVKYILQRKDTQCPDCKTFSEAKILENADKEYENEMFTLYKVKNYSPLINSSTKTIYKKINPVRYEIELQNIRDLAQLNFMESYNTNWKLFVEPYSEINCGDKVDLNELTSECPSTSSLINFSDLWPASNPEYKDKIYSEDLKHLNIWRISTAALSSGYSSGYYKRNDDGTFNVKFVLFYTPQTTYILSVLVSLIFVIVSVGILFLPAPLLEKIRKK